jgi:hypothetical protein
MRTHSKRTRLRRTGAVGLIVAGLAAATLASSPADAADAADAANRIASRSKTSTTEHQRGVVLECTGSNRAHSAYVDLYENDKHGNYLQVVLDGNPKLAASRQPADIWRAGEVSTGIKIRHQRARIVGTAPKVGRRHHVHAENDDAGNLIVSDGFHRRLRDDLVLRYDGHRIELTCAPAFFYSLDVTTTPTI